MRGGRGESRGFAVCGGEGVVGGELAEVGADGIVVDVVAVGEEVGAVSDAVVGEGALPDGVGGG